MKTIRKAEDKFRTLPEEYPAFTEEIDFSRLLQDVRQSVARLEQSSDFEPFPILVSDRLQQLADEAKPSMDLLPSGSDDVLYKHMLRDRSDILLEREEKKKGRR